MLAAITHQVIIIAPLNWGLGHASRCIPIINQLLAQHNKVIIASDGDALQFLKQEFNTLPVEILPAYDITYSKHNWSFVPHLLVQFFKINNAIQLENKAIAALIKKYSATIIISDNRYGVYNSACRSIFITHQLMLKMPRYLQAVEKWVHAAIIKRIQNFDECWIPDVAGNDSCSGDLAHKYPLNSNYHYMGILSRLKKYDVTPTFDYLFVLSGPEPQRSILQNLIFTSILPHIINQKIVIVLGKQMELPIINYNNVTVFAIANTTLINTLYLEAKVIICRSGYSSLMDLQRLNRKAIIIPTPGQTEQEYLGVYHHQKNHWCIPQNKFTFETLTIGAEKLKN